MHSKRLRRHLILAIVAGILIVTSFYCVSFAKERWVDIPDLKATSFNWRLGMALAYTALLFLAATMMIGPIRVIRGKPITVNNMLRRDVGLWAGGLALRHMIVGSFMHTDGLKLWTLFVTGPPSPGNWLPIYTNYFGLANYAGLFQGTLLAIILLISSNYALKKLGPVKWKLGQRLTYLAYVAIVVHALAYQVVEQRAWTLRGITIGILLAIGLVQIIAFISYRRRYHSS